MTDFFLEIKIFEKFFEEILENSPILSSLLDLCLGKKGPADKDNLKIIFDRVIIKDVPVIFFFNISNDVSVCKPVLIPWTGETVQEHNFKKMFYSSSQYIETCICYNKNTSTTLFSRSVIERANQDIFDARLNGNLDMLLNNCPTHLKPLYQKTNQEHIFFEGLLYYEYCLKNTNN